MAKVGPTGRGRRRSQADRGIPRRPVRGAHPARVGRDEMNLAEFPFALLADRHPRGPQTISFTDTISGKDGPVERIWTVTGSDEFGLPLASDEMVYVGLMEATREQGFHSRTVYVTRYSLIKRLGWPDKGESYKRVQSALDRLLGVTIKAERAFWDNRKRRYVDVGFHIIDDYAIYDEQPGRKPQVTEAAEDSAQRRLPFSYIAWNQVIFASFQSGYIKHLDTAFFFGLRSALSRRLYRYLDKKRYDGKPVFQIGLKKLAFEKLGMSRAYYPSHIKQELARAHAELTEKGFLRDVSYQERSGDGDDLVVYRFTDRRYLIEQEAAEPPQRDELTASLVEAGVTEAVAQELSAHHADEARAQLSYLPFRDAQDPAALLVEAIRGSWEPPAACLQRQREQQALDEERARREQGKQRAQDRERERAIESQAAEAVLAGLPEAAQERLRQRVHEQIAAESPLVAKSPHSAAYGAILREQLHQAIAEEYPAELEEQRSERARAELRAAAGAGRWLGRRHATPSELLVHRVRPRR